MNQPLDDSPFALGVAKSEQYRVLFEMAADCLLILDMSGKIVEINQTGCRQRGYTKSEMIGRHISEFDPPSFAAAVPARMAQLHEFGQIRFESAHICKDGQVMPVEIHSRVITFDGEPHVLSVIRDITAQKEVEAAIRLAHHKLEEQTNFHSAVFESAADGILIADPQTMQFVNANQSMCDLLGYSRDELLRLGVPEIHPKEEMDLVIKTFARQASGELKVATLPILRKDGSVFYADITATNFDQQGHTYTVGFFRDISERKKAEATIWRQANYDWLTSLPNRQQLQARLQAEIDNAAANGMRLALIFLDLDRFKDVNDTLGHHIGDKLLVEAARRIQGCVRSTDFVARLGGDEFTIVLPHLQKDANLDKVCGLLIEKMHEPYTVENDRVYVSASIGVSVYPDDARLAEDLLKHADQAMYLAKSQGRNGYSYFTPSLQEAVSLRLRLRSDLESALANNEFRIHFQPIIDLKNNASLKVEALLRWEHPKLGLMGPQTFIPLLEETGLILEVGDFVFRESAQHFAKLRSTLSGDIQVSVNVSPAQFHSERFQPANWLKLLEQLGLPPRFFTIEITEGLLLNDDTAIYAKLEEFRDAGLSIAIDDFGTGYSALSYLTRLGLDYLKIDMSFVQRIEHNERDLSLCKGIVAIAHKLQMKVVAEGIETTTQLALLKEMGCDYAQGFYFSRPVPAHQIEGVLGLACGS
jgi:diguanylate cyclase (GGDEF)-like protein/PAS domain S-box-containing protein